MRKEIVVSFQFEGMHRWPNAPQELTERYLKNLHRHIFHVRAWREVNHNDRDVEFIAFKREMIDYITFNNPSVPVDLINDSCETIAEKLLKKFGLSKCEVLEDGENGAVVTA